MNSVNNHGHELWHSTHRFLFMPHGYADNVIKWKPRNRIASRTVAKCFFRADGGTSFWRQYSAILRFIALGDRLYLKIEPGFAFTKDGYTPIESRRIVKVLIQFGFIMTLNVE